MTRFLGAAAFTGLLVATPRAQNTDQMARIENDFRVIPDFAYLTASNVEAKARSLCPAQRDAAAADLDLYYHGGCSVTHTIMESIGTKR